MQMHHHFRSRFLTDSLSAMGFCSSYPEVRRFEENAAAFVVPDILESQKSISYRMFLFVADNVDHNIATLDEKGTFHRMGIIADATPGTKVSNAVLRKKLCELYVTHETRIPVKEYRFAKQVCSNMKFQPVPLVNDEDHRIYLLWEVSFRFHLPVPNWQGMMHTLNSNSRHPGQSSVMFLPMIDMYPGDRTYTLSTLEFICKLASKHNISPVVIFDQSVF